MKTETNFNQQKRPAKNSKIIIAMTAFIFTVLLICMETTLMSQDQPPAYTKPSVWFGVSGAANLNYFQGTTQQLNSSTYAPTAFGKGNGVGLFVAPSIEFYQPGRLFGLILQGGYDSRKGTFDRVISPCNCPQDLSTDLSYITLEPSLRIAPFKNNFYLFGGPRFAFVRSKSFTYQLGINPDIPDQAPTPEVNGDFFRMNKNLISLQVGLGMDLPLSGDEKRTQVMFSPYASFHPYIGQRPRSVESWDMTTIRVGATLKFGKGKLVKEDEPEEVAVIIPLAPLVTFTVNSPRNIPGERSVRETFPIRNYVFFDLGSTEIPDRYVLLSKNQVPDFKEDKLESFASKIVNGRSVRQMTAYYNILNILGDRMNSNPNATITLAGSSDKGPADGRTMATSIQKYLIDIFSINASRIKIEGRGSPKISSEQPGGVSELTLLRQEDRRVTIESNSPSLLMEFQSGPGAALKPVEILAIQTAPLDSYVKFNAIGAKEAYTNWSVEMKDDIGKVQYYGPYTDEEVAIPGKNILGTRPEGNYTATMVGTTSDGRTFRKEVPVNLVLWTPDTANEGMRYSVIYEFDDSRAIKMYQDYLTNVVTPKIPEDGSVVIHGYTDVIGDAANNKQLSLARANDVRQIMQNTLNKSGRKDVKIEVYGFGEDEAFSPFENRLPEERFYNRTVLIDIIPAK